MKTSCSQTAGRRRTRRRHRGGGAGCSGSPVAGFSFESDLATNAGAMGGRRRKHRRTKHHRSTRKGMRRKTARRAYKH